MRQQPLPEGIRPLGHLRVCCEAAGVAFAVFLVFAWISNDFALGWDEGFTFDRLAVLRPWLSQWLDRSSPDRSALFERAILDRHWRFSRDEPDGHGPFYALLALAGHELTSGFLPPPVSYRVGSIALFAFACGSVYGTLRPRRGLLPAIVACALLAATPRLVPEFSYALIDGPLVSLALLTWSGFVAAMQATRRLGGVYFGVPLGLAMANKLTGWLLPLPYIAWSICLAGHASRRTRVTTLAVGLIVALATCFVLNVGWWPSPIEGVRTFFRSNLSRAETIPIPILFFGDRYQFSLPWYNTLVWTAIAMPASTVLLGLVGILAGCRNFRTDASPSLLLCNWTLLMVVRALPQAPGHDGTRQIAVSFAFLCILAAHGLLAIDRWLSAQWSNARWKRAVSVFVTCMGVAGVAESVVANVRYHPCQLSYYSPLAGGLRGAARLGFEPTYFWDALTQDVLDWLNTHTDDGRAVFFRNNPTSFDYLENWGLLRVQRWRPGVSARPQWLVLQHRPGIFLPADEWLVANRSPVFEKRLQDVPLISVYAFDDWLLAQQAVAGGHVPAPEAAGLLP